MAAAGVKPGGTFAKGVARFDGGTWDLGAIEALGPGGEPGFAGFGGGGGSNARFAFAWAWAWAWVAFAWSTC